MLVKTRQQFFAKRLSLRKKDSIELKKYVH